MIKEVQSYTSGETAVKIARDLEQAILKGAIAAGEQLPTVRGLAQALGVSPGTAAAAYRRLKSRGLVRTDGRRGTVVLGAVESALQVPHSEHLRDLGSGNPDPALLPRLGPFLAQLDPEPRLYGGALRYEPLEELARRELESDGLEVPAVAVLSGAMSALERALREYAAPGDRVAVEDPGFSGVLELVRRMGLEAVPIPLDQQGLLPEELERALASGLEAVIVTPRAQNPTGAMLSERRSHELRTVLSHHPEILLLEDDHAGPIAGAPLRSIADGDRPRYLYVRSVSKWLGPDLRLAVATGSRETLRLLEHRQLADIRWVSHVLQELVFRLWSDRAVRALLRRAERTYGKRRQALLKALSQRQIEASGASGLNVWLPVPDETTAVRALAERGWVVAAGESFRLRAPPAIRVSIASLEVPEADKLGRDIEIVLRPPQRTATA